MSFAKSANYLNHVIFNGSFSSISCVQGQYVLTFVEDWSPSFWVEDFLRQKLKTLQQYIMRPHGNCQTLIMKRTIEITVLLFFVIFAKLCDPLIFQNFFFLGRAVVPLAPAGPFAYVSDRRLLMRRDIIAIIIYISKLLNIWNWSKQQNLATQIILGSYKILWRKLKKG